MQWLEEAELALQMLALHNNIIVKITQHCLDKAESSIQRLIKHDVANALALETQHGWLVAIKLCVKKVNKEGITTVGQLCLEVKEVKLQQLAKICRDITRVSPAMSTLDENVRNSLDQLHLHLDALLQHTTTSSAADLRATPPLASALALQLAPPPAPAPIPVWAWDPILAPDPTPPTGVTLAAAPAPAPPPLWAQVQTPAPHSRHPLFPDA